MALIHCTAARHSRDDPGMLEDASIPPCPLMPALEKVLRDPQEISDGNRHRFEISHTKKPNEGLVRHFLRNFVMGAAAGKAEHPVVEQLMKPLHDLGPHGERVAFGAAQPLQTIGRDVGSRARPDETAGKRAWRRHTGGVDRVGLEGSRSHHRALYGPARRIEPTEP